MPDLVLIRASIPSSDVEDLLSTDTLLHSLWWCFRLPSEVVSSRRFAKKVPLVFVPVETPGGALFQVELSYSWAPVTVPEGTNTKATSAKSHFCAYPSNRRPSPRSGLVLRPLTVRRL